MLSMLLTALGLSVITGKDALAQTVLPPQILCSDAGAGGYQAFPDAVRLQNGDLFCVLYAGYGHIALPNEQLPKGARVCAVRSIDNGTTWGPATIVADTPYDDRDPSICQLADGTMLCNWFTYYGSGAKSPTERPDAYKEIWLARSTDNGHTWSEPELLPTVAGARWGCTSPIRTLSDGRLIMPIYREYVEPLRVWTAVIFSPDNGLTWSEPVWVDENNPDNDEADVIELPNGRILCVMRSNEGDCGMWQSWSEDGGLTWAPSEKIGFPGHAPYLLRCRNGVLICAHRLPQTSLHFSLDDGQTWSDNVFIDDFIGAYPSLVEMPDGRVLMIYYEEGENSKIRSRWLTVTDSNVSLSTSK